MSNSVIISLILGFSPYIIMNEELKTILKKLAELIFDHYMKNINSKIINSTVKAK